MKPIKICSVDGCDKRVAGWGWCSKHYQRWKRHGHPLAGGAFLYSTPEEAFSARTKRQGDCLVWTGSASAEGYGRMQVDGKSMLSHRYAWERSNGPIPDGMHIDHVCRVHACCNPRHLRVVTNKQNSEHTGLRALNTSGYRGVCWAKRERKWRAYVTHNGKQHYAGFHETPEEAAEAAKAKRLELFTHNNLDRVA